MTKDTRKGGDLSQWSKRLLILVTGLDVAEALISIRLVFVPVLGIKPRALCRIGKRCTLELHLQPYSSHFKFEGKYC